MHGDKGEENKLSRKRSDLGRRDGQGRAFPSCLSHTRRGRRNGVPSRPPRPPTPGCAGGPPPSRGRRSPPSRCRPPPPPPPNHDQRRRSPPPRSATRRLRSGRRGSGGGGRPTWCTPGASPGCGTRRRGWTIWSFPWI